MKNILKQINESKKYVLSKINFSPEIALVLGSGLGSFAETLDEPVSLPYGKIPNFAKSTIEGHAGELVIGKKNNIPIVCMKGRFHYYEGYSLETITFPIRLFSALGVKALVLTNAAGGINTGFTPGDLMIINDHINFTGENPLIGPNLIEFGPRFPDMSNAYSKRLISCAKDTAASQQLKLKEGVYLATSGPSYETPAEIKMFRTWGADAVGMSTVPEAIIANHSGIEVFAISCITNMAAGILNQPLSHDEVTETANKVKHDFIKFISSFIKTI